METDETDALRGSETILIAEDDEALRVLISSILSEFGYNVLISSDGNDAIAKFIDNKDSVDLAVLDMIMPYKNGKQVYETISKLRPGIKCIIASGYLSEILQNKNTQDNMFKYIMKPFPPLSLIKMIRATLDDR